MSKSKTGKFILPCLTLHGKDFIEKFNNYSLIEARLGDKSKPELYNENNIAVLINRKDSILNFNHPAIECVYNYGDLVYGNQIMVVIKFPEELQNTDIKSNFLKSKFSKLYKDPAKFTTGEVLQVLTKDKVLRKKIEERIGMKLGDAELGSQIVEENEFFT